jgi:hypothetical protein
VVPRDQQLDSMRKLRHPVEESVHLVEDVEVREVPAVDEDVSFGDRQLSVTIVRI